MTGVISHLIGRIKQSVRFGFYFLSWKSEHVFFIVVCMIIYKQIEFRTLEIEFGCLIRCENVIFLIEER